MYQAYQIKNSNDFIHVISFTSEKNQQKHQTADYTKKFAAVLYPNCEKEPVFTSVE